MENIVILYGSTTGNTEEVATKIQGEFGAEIAKVFNVTDVNLDDLKDFSNIILGTSTWGSGEMQDDFETFVEEFDNIDFSRKKVALFGLGDQDSHGDTFLNGLAELYNKLVEKNADVIGKTSCEGYEFEDSEAVIDGKFIGMAIDEDNQSDLTDERVKNWTVELKKQFL
ncbi:MAG: flavodoxin [Bacteroidota bacterium]